MSTAFSNSPATTHGLLPVILLELIFIITIILVIIPLLYSFISWWDKRGVKETTPQFPVGGGGRDDDLWTRLKNGIKRLFGRT